MLKFFGRFIIGGRSGKREQAWAVFLMWSAAFAWSAFKETQGLTLGGTQSILTVALPLVVANLALAHGMEWHSSQSAWGNGQ